jgi:hypothetical protein
MGDGMKLIDITGPLANDMWWSGEPFPKLLIEERHGYEDGFGEFSYTAINGLHVFYDLFDRQVDCLSQTTKNRGVPI